MSRRTDNSKSKPKMKTKSKFPLSTPASTPSVLGPSRVKADVQFLGLVTTTTSTSTNRTTSRTAFASAPASKSTTAKERSRDDGGVECARVVEFDSRSLAQPFLDGEALGRARWWRDEMRREAGT